MNYRLIVLFLVFLLLTPAYAFALTVSYYDSNNKEIFWADSTNKDDYVTSLTIGGLGKGTIKFVPDQINVPFDIKKKGDRQAIKVPTGSYGFIFNSAECYAFATSVKTTNPNSLSVSFNLPNEGAQPPCYKTPVSPVEPPVKPPVDPVDPPIKPPVDPVDPPVYPGDGDGSGDGSGNGSGCGACCGAMTEIFGHLVDSAESSNVTLNDMSHVLGNLLDVTEESGLKLDAINDSLGMVIDGIDGTNTRLDGVNNRLDGVNNRLDETNDILTDIRKQVTPTGTYSIPKVDFNRVDAPYVDKIGRVTDNNVYFSDPGQSNQRVVMPGQPDIFYPFAIGESMNRDSVWKSDKPLIPGSPGQKDTPGAKDNPGVKQPSGSKQPSGTKQPTGVKDGVINRDPVRSKDQFTQDAVMQKGKTSTRDPALVPGSTIEKSPVPSTTKPGQRENVLVPDPVYPVDKSPVQQRNNFFEKQEVLK